MTSLFDAVPYLSNYHSSFVVLAALSMTVLVQNFLSAPLAFFNAEQTPGMPLKLDHARLSFRVLRTYSNSAETFPAFGWALLVAIIAGAPPAWINGLAILYLVFRMLFWVTYYSGVGKVAGGPRTAFFVGGLLTNIVLAGAAIWALLS